MKTPLLAITLFSASAAFGQPVNLNRCQTDNTFAYWTPDACAQGDDNNGSFLLTETARNFTEHVKHAECLWRASVSDNKLYGPPPRGQSRRTRPHPECDYPTPK